DLCTLLDRRFFVVLRNDAWLGKKFAHTLRFCCGDEEVDREVRRTVRKSESRSWRTCGKIRVERQTGRNSVSRRHARRDADRIWGNSRTRSYAAAPTAGTPEKSERPPVVVPAKPSSVPMSWANERDAETTRASISTCCDLRSSCRIRLSITGIVIGISRMIS